MVYLTHLLFLSLLFSSCSSLEQILDSTMTIQWSVSGDSIDITFICKLSTGYCSIGFAESMTNCDMIAALSDGTTVTLQDYYSYNHNTPATDQARAVPTTSFTLQVASTQMATLTSPSNESSLREMLTTRTSYLT